MQAAPVRCRPVMNSSEPCGRSIAVSEPLYRSCSCARQKEVRK
jgi:hypothetical protein